MGAGERACFVGPNSLVIKGGRHKKKLLPAAPRPGRKGTGLFFHVGGFVAFVVT